MEINEKELEERGWIKNECKDRTEKCCGEFCEAEKLLGENPTPETLIESREYVNCPFLEEFYETEKYKKAAKELEEWDKLVDNLYLQCPEKSHEEIHELACKITDEKERS